jgi:hypothetical protein
MKASHLFGGIVLLTLLLFSCKKQPNFSESSSDLLAEYLVQYNNRFIKSTDEISVVFKKNLVSVNEVGKEVKPGGIEILPKVEGAFVWKTPSTIGFQPKSRLDNGKKYEININLNKLTTSEKFEEDIDLHLIFEVIPQSLSIEFDPLTYDENGALVQKGRIASNDLLTLEDARSMIVLDADVQKNASIEWVEGGSTTAEFEIHNIEKKESPSSIRLEWNGTSVDEKFSGKKEINIPSENDFYVMHSLANTEQKITLVFSEQLKENQNLKGLIRVNGKNADYNYEINRNFAFIYLKETIKDKFELSIDQGIISDDGKKLDRAFKTNLKFEPPSPELAQERTGMIVPTEGKTIVPFKAKNLQYVDVEIFKIYANNVLQFLQYNNLNSYIGDRTVGRVVYEEKIDLSSINNEDNEDNWVRYALDLNQFVKDDLGALYRIRIGFRHGYAKGLPCDEMKAASTLINDGTYGLDDYGNDYSGYDYKERENPCHRSYYMSNRFIEQNVLSTNIGLIAKANRETNTWYIHTTNIRESGPLTEVQVELYDFQQQLVGSSVSNLDGLAVVETEREPSFAIAKWNGQYEYLNLQRSYSNSLSDFNVSGRKREKGIDGLIYGERDVWRPGDTMYLSFILFDENSSKEEKHPVSFTVKNSRGKTALQSLAEKQVGNIYTCRVPTKISDPTGDWTAKVKVGNIDIVKSLKVETIKPNRLKIQFDGLDKEVAIHDATSRGVQIEAKWLHGAAAANLQSNIEVEYQAKNTKFDGYLSYEFDDPARKTNYQPLTVLDEKLNAEGRSTFNLKKARYTKPSGKLNARIKARVYEKSGNFSEVYRTCSVSPYASYVGINIPKSKWGGNFIQSNTDVNVPIVVLDDDGQPIKNRKLSIGLYQSEWSWWYNRSYNRMYEFNSSTHKGAIEKINLVTNGDGKANWQPKLEGYGNYLVRVCDDVSGHCTGSLFYSSEWGYPEGDLNNPKTFTLSSDKSNYSIGEAAKVKIPSNAKSQILVSIENANRVLKSYWVEGKKDLTEIEIPISADMFPNAYIHAMLIQPYDEHSNDLPLRLYGVVPISVDDASKKLIPKLNVAKELKPNQPFEVKVSEEEGRPMNYTIAVVDEGLLSLTNYKTPSPFDHFYSKQALGIDTWDMYDYVATSYDKGILSAFSVGGDGVVIAQGEAKTNRFLPVVDFKGPFRLDKKQTNVHAFSLGNYVGEVRVMVIAASDHSFGKVDQSIPVRQDLMVASTLPRVLAPGESTNFGVNVFAMNERVKTVDITLNEKDGSSLKSDYFSTLNFDKPEDKITYFGVDVGEHIGVKSFEVTATSGGLVVKDEININVINPNPIQTKTVDFVIEPNSKKEVSYSLFGMAGTNDISIQLYSLPSFNLESRLNYLIRYPYGCLEQTVSAAFAQLYLNDITELNDTKLAKVKDNINIAISRLSSFQKSSGSFTTWPTGLATDLWASIYAGDFMIEAKEKGYYIPSDLMSNWLIAEKRRANRWVDEDSYGGELTQAYRLHVLAKSGNAELGAMNRFRNTKMNSSTSVYLLATAYMYIGQEEIANNLVKNVLVKIPVYNGNSMTYGSSLRDEGIMLNYYRLTKNENEAVKLLRQMSQKLSSSQWYNTQSIAMSLVNIGRYIDGKESNGLKGSFQNEDGGKIDFNTNKSIFTRPLLNPKTLSGVKNVSVENLANEKLFGQLIVSGQPMIGDELNTENKHISLNIKYVDRNNMMVNVNEMKQGEDFYAICTVKHLNTMPYGFNNLALSYKLPSGFEISNERITGMSSFGNESNYSYKDIRDSSIDYFFNLNKGESKSFVIGLNSTYSGEFYLPTSYCESMYEKDIQASTKGKWIQILPSQ